MTGEAVAFYVISALILGFAVLVVSTRNTVHAVLYLVLNFLAVAALYVLLTAQFLAVIQILVYAGGIVVLYLFVVMLVNLKRPPEDHSAPQRRGWLGVGLAGLVLAQLGAILVWGGTGVAGRSTDDAEQRPGASITSSASACCFTPITWCPSKSRRCCCSSRWWAQLSWPRGSSEKS